MKKFIYIAFILCFTVPAFAGMYPMTQTQQQYPQYQTQKIQSMPVGTFKKKKDGTIVQYNDKGKKIGTYKISGNKLISPKK